MKILTIILFLITTMIFSSGAALAQKKKSKRQASSGEFKNGLKININYVHDLTNLANFSIGDFAPVFLFNTTRKYIHEIEFNRFKIDQTEYKQLDNQGFIILGNRQTQTEIGLRYQCTRRLLKQEGKFVPQIGLSLMTLYTSYNNIPLVTNSFPRKAVYIGAFLSVVPQLRYNFAKRLFFDLALPMEFVNFGFSAQRIENPAIPQRQQRNGGFELDSYFFDKLHLRLGAGIKI